MLNSHAIFFILNVYNHFLYIACEMAPTGSAFSLLTGVEGYCQYSERNKSIHHQLELVAAKL